MRSNDFDKLASVYDQLASLIFGRSITESQRYFLNKIPEGSNILILGGGTGWILNELFKIKDNVSVCYIESSLKMMVIAKEKSNNDKRVQFIHGTESDIPSDYRFDFVITNFYLDLFTDDSLKVVLGKIKRALAPNAHWIVTDFINDRWWQKMMLSVMYFFFRVMSNIESKKLPDWGSELRAIGARPLGSKIFYKGFIETSVYQL